MIVPAYVPGEWVAVVTDGTLAVLPPDTAPAVVAELWAAVRAGASLTDHLQMLLRTGFTHVPPFALVSLAAGEVHAIVRGQVRVEVVTGAGTRVLSGAQMSTWVEEVLTDARSVAVRTGSGDDAGAVDRDALPVLAAVVRVRDVLVDLRPAAVDLRPAAADDAPVEEEPVDAAPVDAAPVDAAPVDAAHEDAAHEDAAHEDAAHEDAAHEDVPVRPVPPSHPVWEPVSAVPRTVGPDAGVAAPQATEDHDGLTVLSSDVVALRRQLPAWTGDGMPALAVPTPRTPPPAKLLMSSGLTVALNRPVLIGRAPQVTRVQNNDIPRLLTVASPNQDISRTHVEVRMDGEDVIVTDLRSTNGVLLLRQGSGPQRLHPGEPTVVEAGVVVDLGEGVTFIVEAGG